MFELIVNVERMEDDVPANVVAMATASRLQAWVTGIHVVAVYPPVLAMPEAMAVLDSEERAALAHQGWWRELCARHGVQGEWEVIRGLYVPALAKRSRLAGFVVSELPVRNPDAPIGFDNITRTLFGGGAPMLLVPETWQGPGTLERVLVAWNGSGESAEAVRAALPLLQRASSVRVLDGEPNGLPGLAPPRLPLRAWLARQGVTVDWQDFHDEPGIGRSLLDQARAMDAQLLVMGGWGRSRLSELVLGGATRHVLEHTHLPVLMAH